MPPRVEHLMSDTLKKIAEKRNMLIPHTVTVEKRIPADSAAPDKQVYFDNRIPDPASKDESMKKSLDYAPYWGTHKWDKNGNYVTDKKKLIKKT